MSVARTGWGRLRRLFRGGRGADPRSRIGGTGEEVLALAVAGKEMALRPEHSPAIAVRGALALGCDGASFRVLDDRQVTHRSLTTAGLPDEPHEATALSAAMADLVLERGETVVTRSTTPDEGELPLPLPHPSGDIVAAIASPIWIEGWIAAVLVGVVRAEERLTPHTVAAFELLASHTALAIDAAHRTEERQQTARRLEQGDRLKTEFLTTISHEMRTPLTVLIGSGLTLEHTWLDLDDDSRLGLVGSMNANARALDEMVSNLLDYARLDAGELWVSFEPFDISAMLRAVVERAEGTIGPRRLETAFEEGLLVSGDIVLIRRIVSHLLRNAAEHTPPGTTVTASCHRREREVVVQIADDGPGIEDDDLPFVGERFFRSGDTNARPRGLGLGLALATGILELHGTTLVVENGPDGGARCSFSLLWVPDPSELAVDRDESRSDAYAPDHGRT
jgi:signal transduction histidine kinase